MTICMNNKLGNMCHICLKECAYGAATVKAAATLKAAKINRKTR
jgi:hypothetical protein